MAPSPAHEEQLLRDRAEKAYALARRRVFDLPGYPDAALTREQAEIIAELEQADAQLKAHREAGFGKGDDPKIPTDNSDGAYDPYGPPHLDHNRSVQRTAQSDAATGD